MRFSLGLLSFAALAVAHDTSLRDVREAFERANIPRAISINFNPTALLDVTFPQTSGQQITLQVGQELPLNATVGPPTYGVSGHVGHGPFVLASVDPDAPTPENPTSAQIRHFLGGNFVPVREGYSEVEPLRNMTPAISEFRPPAPPGGLHRYIFLLFNQPEGFNEQTFVTPTTPFSMFNISSFMEATGLGDPIAGTFMVVRPAPTAA